MTPLRVLLVAAGIAVAGFLVVRKSSNLISETPPLTPESVDGRTSSVSARAAALAAASDAAPTGNDRRPADAPRALAAFELSTESTASPPQVETAASNLELQVTLISEMAMLELEWKELHRSLGWWTKGAFEAAWRRNDYFEFDVAPSGREIDGKLVSIRRSKDGRYQMVTLPRASFEREYRIFDQCRDKSDEIRKKKAELVAAQAIGSTSPAREQ